MGLAVNDITVQIAFGSCSFCRFDMDRSRDKRTRVPREWLYEIEISLR